MADPNPKRLRHLTISSVWFFVIALIPLFIALILFLAAWFSKSFVPAIVGAFFIIPVIILVFLGIKGMLINMKLEPSEVFISESTLRVGQPFILSFRQMAKRDVTVTSLSFQLIMRESARYTRGTDTTTVTHDHVIEEYEQLGQHYLAGMTIHEERTLHIPPGAMHTFSAKDNHIRWFVIIKVIIPNWPDSVEEYDITVLPEVFEGE